MTINERFLKQITKEIIEEEVGSNLCDVESEELKRLAKVIPIKLKEKNDDEISEVISKLVEVVIYEILHKRGYSH